MMDDLVREWISTGKAPDVATSDEALAAFDLWVDGHHVGRSGMTPRGMTWVLKRLGVKSMGRYPKRWLINWR